jgi:HSP20 family protein
MAEQQNQQKEFFTEIKNEFKEIGSKVNKMFDELVHGKDVRRGFTPAADVWETKEEMVYELDIPGCQRSDFSVQVRDNTLVIRGQRTRNVTGDLTVHMKERHFGEFERTFIVPGNVDQNAIKAKYDNGVLRVTMPKESVEANSTEVNVD